MRANQYKPIASDDLMSKFHSLPRELRQEVLFKAECFKNRANAQKPAGEKVGLRLRDAVVVVMSVIFYEPLWKEAKERDNFAKSGLNFKRSG